MDYSCHAVGIFAVVNSVLPCNSIDPSGMINDIFFHFSFVIYISDLFSPRIDPRITRIMYKFHERLFKNGHSEIWCLGVTEKIAQKNIFFRNF